MKLLESDWKLACLVNEAGESPLHIAAREELLQVVQMILDTTPSADELMALQEVVNRIHAGASGSPLVIAELLKHCPDASKQLDPSGKNVFHIAIIYCKYSTVCRLLHMPELEGMINEPDADGNTLLHLAAKYRSNALLMLLSRDRRMDMTIMNKDGQTALDLIEMDPENHEIQVLPHASCTFGPT